MPCLPQPPMKAMPTCLREQERCQAKGRRPPPNLPTLRQPPSPLGWFVFFFLDLTDQRLPLNTLSLDDEVFPFVTIWGRMYSGGGDKIKGLFWRVGGRAGRNSQAAGPRECGALGPLASTMDSVSSGCQAPEHSCQPRSGAARLPQPLPSSLMDFCF